MAATNVNLSPRAPRPFLFSATARSSAFLLRLLPDNCSFSPTKKYRNVSGYVELEFTEPAVGFWGMRFPGDRVVTAPQPLAPKAEAPAAIATPRISEIKPAIPAPVKKDLEAKILEPKLVAPPAPRIAPPAALAPARANPEVPVNVAPENSIEPSFPIVDPSRGADAKAFIIS